jgi:hypothetical protein
MPATLPAWLNTAFAKTVNIFSEMTPEPRTRLSHLVRLTCAQAPSEPFFWHMRIVRKIKAAIGAEWQLD